MSELISPWDLLLFTKEVSSTSGWGQVGAGWREPLLLGPATLPNEQNHCLDSRILRPTSHKSRGKRNQALKLFPGYYWPDSLEILGSLKMLARASMRTGDTVAFAFIAAIPLFLVWLALIPLRTGVESSLVGFSRSRRESLGDSLVARNACRLGHDFYSSPYGSWNKSHLS